MGNLCGISCTIRLACTKSQLRSMTQPLFKEMRLCHITLAGVCQIIPLRLSCDCIVLCTVCALLFYIARDFHFVGIVKVNLLNLVLNLVRANIFCRQSVLELNSCNYLE